MFAAYYIHFVVGSELVGTGDSQTLCFLVFVVVKYFHVKLELCFC